MAGLVTGIQAQLHLARPLDHLFDCHPVTPNPQQSEDPNIDQENLLGLRLDLGTHQNYQRESLSPRLGIADSQKRVSAGHKDYQVGSLYIYRPKSSEKGREHHYWRDLRIEAVAVVSRLPVAALLKKV